MTADNIIELPKRAAPIALRGVGKIYSSGKGSFVALSATDIDIAAGEVTALVGPSGSGKTTLLSIIGCIIRPTRGAVVVHGRDVATLSEDERCRVRLAHVGFVFQSYNLFPTLTARQNVEVALDLKGVTGATRRRTAQALLEQVELGEKANAHPADLSGGQKQRIAIARALAGAPDIVLADEPTAALDTQNGRHVMGIFRALAHNEKRAVVVVTHDSRILEFADRIVTLDDGRIASDKQRQPEPLPAALTASLIRRPRTFDMALSEMAVP